LELSRIYVTILLMPITLTPEQEAWLQAHVANGDFMSIQEAASQLIDERIAERAIEETEGLAWAKPYVDEARVAIGRGEFVSQNSTGRTMLRYLPHSRIDDAAHRFFAGTS
jgi:antitoxin ParD1/3/4